MIQQLRTAHTLAVCAACMALSLVFCTNVDAACRNTQPFNKWLSSFTDEATQAGLSAAALRALAPVRFSSAVIDRDRSAAVFAQDFLTFARRMVSGYRLEHGARQLRQRARLFAELERAFGVPGPVITAFWALETDFGANNGDFPTLDALATLAYDCRRPALFRP